MIVWLYRMTFFVTPLSYFCENICWMLLSSCSFFFFTRIIIFNKILGILFIVIFSSIWAISYQIGHCPQRRVVMSVYIIDIFSLDLQRIFINVAYLPCCNVKEFEYYFACAAQRKNKIPLVRTELFLHHCDNTIDLVI